MRITYDTATGDFAFEDGTIRPFGASIEARLDRHGETIHFDGLEFGLTITRDGGDPETHTFPPPGVTYRSTDQDLLTVVPVRWRPDEVITVEVRITTAGQTMTGRHGLTVPRPPRPYPSWVWDSTRWAAPVPEPDDGGLYQWDEAGKKWSALPD